MIAFIDFGPRASEMSGLPIFHRNHLSDLRARGLRRVHLALPELRLQIEAAEEVQGIGLDVVSAIHPTAVVSPQAHLGRNIYLGPLAIVGPEAHLGDFCRILNGASVAHHSRLGRGVRVSDGARIAGHVTVGENTLLGLGATVNFHLSIGRDVVIVSGASVYDSVPDHHTVRIDGNAYARGA